jgi:hypothetical protein
MENDKQEFKTQTVAYGWQQSYLKTQLSWITNRVI